MYGAWRASVWAEAASGNAQAFPVHGTWGPRGPRTVTSNQIARRRLKREIVKTRLRVLTRFPKARETKNCA